MLQYVAYRTAYSEVMQIDGIYTDHVKIHSVEMNDGTAVGVVGQVFKQVFR